MAATQSEPQQNEVNRENVQQDQSSVPENASLLQNGTERSVGRGLVSFECGNSKIKPPGQNINTEMSQYRQDPSVGPGVHHPDSNTNSEDLSKTNHCENKSFTHNTEQSDQSFVKVPSDNGNQNIPGYGLTFPQRGSYHPDHPAGNLLQPGGENSLHQSNFGPFNPQMRHGYSGSKPITGPGSGPPRPLSTSPNMTSPSNFAPHMQQQRFLSGQSISQPTGPTPTLNQLLQSSNPVHRYQNSYGDYSLPKQGSDQPQGSVPYNQAWPPRPMGPYGSQQSLPGYRPQGPMGGRGGQYGGGSGSPGPGPVYPPASGSPSTGPGAQGPQYPYPQRYPSPTPPAPPPARPPFPPHQMGSGPYGGGGQSPNGSGPGSYPERYPGPGAGPGQQPPSPGQTVAAPQSSPQPPPPSLSPHQNYPPNRPPQSSTPNAPEPADLTGQNSNDSSSGPAPGTPNSQGMRPTPSPTGSTGSRSMSPAVGSQQNIPMPPRPSSSQSDGGSTPGTGASRISHSPVSNQEAPFGCAPGPGAPRINQSPVSNQVDVAGGYPGPLQHMHGYKMGGPSMGGQPMPSHPPSPYSSQQHYPQQGNYGPRPQGQLGYGPNQSYSQPPQTNSNIPPGSQYPTRPMPNHAPPHSQFPGYQGWGPGSPGNMMGGPNTNHLGGSSGASGKGGPVTTTPSATPPSATQPPQSNSSPGPRSHTPPHQAYLKQQLQHKVAFGSAGSGMPPSPGSYPNNATPLGMGPPHHHPMGPPSMGPPNSHVGQPPPSSTPNSHLSLDTPTTTPSDLHDNGITTTATGTVMSSSQGGVTQLVTTGPDGAPIDEASQQSTLSNASAASGEDPSCTPSKSRKDNMYHPSTPQSTVPSPGAASMNSMHDEYPPDSSPTWPRTPASPVYNSHMPQDLYRPKKQDSLSKLYEMDDAPDRRLWLDKLLQYMEDRGSPITTCPTISKNPLDLFRLYLYVKERGGFMEVCKVQCSSMVTKNKIWKDIAGLLGIGASSSAAYTLRKHYTKNLLPYECQFDRGGIDPQPIINQVEATSKKKSSKAAPVPSPGSSNSQDSFPSGGGGSGSMDGYSYGYPPDYNNQRPPSQSNQVTAGVGVPAASAGDNISVSNPFDDARPPRPGMQGNYQNQGGNYPQYPDQYNQQYPPNRPIYPPYGPDADRGYSQGTSTGPGAGSPSQSGTPPGPDPYNRYNMAPGQPPGYPPRPGFGGSQPPSGPNPQTPPAQPPGQGYPPPQQGYYGQDQGYPGQGQGPGGGTAPYPGGQPNKGMPPPGPQPRRHPDFAKDQQPYPPYNQPRPAIYPGGWPQNNNSQYRGQYGPQQWSQVPPRPGGPPSSTQPPSGPPGPGQWDQQRYPAQPPYQQWNVPSMGSTVVGPRTPVGPRHYRPDGKPYCPMPSSVNVKGQPTGAMQSGPGGAKRELVFPMDSVEAVTPVLYKRRRLTKTDVAPIDAWRMMMALRSGLLAETSWALDVLNILLFDDASIAYFGLAHLPGLLDTLLEHFKHALGEMLEKESEGLNNRQWYEHSTPESKTIDLGSISTPPDPSDRVKVIQGPDYTMQSRRGAQVLLTPSSDEIFVSDQRRSWDNEEPEEAPEAPDYSSTKYIISCFKGEFGLVPFVRLLPDKKCDVKIEKDTTCDQTETKRTRSLNDLLTRVKLEPSETTEVKSEDVNERVRDPAGILRRRRMSDYEDECYSRDEASLYLVTESQDALARRCICISTILRNLTFVPGNEAEFAKNVTFLNLLGKLLLLHHEHPVRTQKQRNYDRDDDADYGDCCSSLQGEGEWWWEFLHHLRENALVCLANMAGHVDLGLYSEDVSRPLLDGLLHWAVCPAAQGQDAFPTVSPASGLSPQRLALEALCKLCVTENNVDLVIATPPHSRLERLCAVLTRLLCRSEEQVLREFSVNLLHYLAAADSGVARTIAAQSPCVSLLVAFIEQAESSAIGVANQLGINALRDNPDCMGTSLDMLRRAARTLLHLSKHPDNQPLFLQQEQRLLALVMSQILDQQVAAIISRVLYHCSSRPPSPEPALP
ncbi:trithorax group protein osa isoform X4 [Homalodisca vitripennis]|uniref:trithorax group protein osa isoform X4 n=1 Tax=Homalodisca vitripennis TaxID=197043 RepID=UPI001EEA21BB|nr:trithorax group protein osa isoform X4 [Homalodisca vitripennis]